MVLVSSEGGLISFTMNVEGMWTGNVIGLTPYDQLVVQNTSSRDQANNLVNTDPSFIDGFYGFVSNGGIVDNLKPIINAGPIYVDDGWATPSCGTEQRPLRRIQDGICSALAGDEVIVADGTYTGDGNRDIDFLGKAITVCSQNGPETCIIDCQGSEAEPHRGFYFHEREDESSILEGITITRGMVFGIGWIEETSGGGILCEDSGPKIVNCILLQNMADDGGGIYNYGGANPIIHNCLFSSNLSISYGGGMYNNNFSNPTLSACRFAQNSANLSGGAMYNYQSNPTLTNCTFNGNRAEAGAGLYLRRNSNPIATNCILWGNTPGEISNSDSSPIVTYSNVEGGYEGIGNIDADPCFVDPASGDYHLKSQAGRWDPVSESWVIDDLTSPCIDSGNPGSPLGDEPVSPDNVRINMGAYGGTAEASKTPAGWGILADLTNDGIVDLVDFGWQTKDWKKTASKQPGDVDRDGDVDYNDVKILAEHWLVGHCVEIPLQNGGFEMGDLTYWTTECEGDGSVVVGAWGATEGNYSARLEACTEWDPDMGVSVCWGNAVLCRTIDLPGTGEYTISFDYSWTSYWAYGWVDVGGDHHDLIDGDGEHFSAQVSGNTVLSIHFWTNNGRECMWLDNVRIECGR
jgi:hypothetical protein